MFQFLRRLRRSRSQPAAKQPPKRAPDTPSSVDRRVFFRQLFVHAVDHVEKAGREFAQRATAGFGQHSTGATGPGTPYYYRGHEQSADFGTQSGVYGPPWPPPYGPPIPAKLRAQLKAAAGQRVAR
jgi:hypothetical protein